MDYAVFGRLGTVGEFARHYVEKAFELAEENPCLSLDVFYDNLFDYMSEVSGLSRDALVNIHHPFHWKFFNYDSSCLEFFSLGGREDPLCIKLKNDEKKDGKCIPSDVLDISYHILENFGNYIIEKRQKFMEKKENKN
jgi:hypothetical protein